MKADHQSSARATSIALLGLALQLVMGLALLIYAFVAKDRPAFSGATLILIGSAVWLVLAVLFDQHRRERLEELEAQAITGGTSVFGEAAQELRVAARRLAWMHRVLVPVLSLILAAGWIGAGIAFFLAHKSYISQPPPDTHFGWALALGFTLGVVGFVFARYVAGLAKDPAWANLRGGAAQAVVAAIAGAGIAIAQLAHYVHFDSIAGAMHAVFPVVMIVIGAEVVLNFLLGLYRPRTADESPRPAMDSRILSFVAAPDRLAESIGGALNYQFGFNVTDSWFYQLVSRWLATLLFVGALVVWLMTSLAVVQPNQQGIVLRFGALHGHTLLPGLHVKAPWPIDTLETIDATTVRSVQLANDPPKVNKSILWTNEHGVPETFFPVQPSAAQKHTATGEDAQQVISDLALVSVEVPLYYVVSDYEKFRALATPEQRDQVMRAVGRRELFEYLATQTVDEVLGEKRQAISEEVAKRINTRLAAMNGGQGAGVTVRFVGLVGVHPPRQTAAMFESVVQNNQTRAANIQAARAYADSELIKVAGSVEKARALVTLIDEIQTKTERLQQMPQPEAGAETPERRALADEVKKLELKAVESISQGKGSAADLLLEVRAARWERHMQQRASAESYGARLAAYRAAPQVYKAQLYFQTLQEVMAQSRVYIVADDGQKVEMRLNLEDSAVSNTVFDAPKALGENK